MQLRGKLEKLDFSDILQMLSSSGKSGKLALTQRAGQGVLVLRQGRVIYAASSAVRETLGNMLLCKGLITEDGLNRGLELQRAATRYRDLMSVAVRPSYGGRNPLTGTVGLRPRSQSLSPVTCRVMIPRRWPMNTLSVKRAEPEAFDGSALADIDHDDRLILWMLERTPARRLEALQNFVEGVVALQHARKISQ